MRVCDDFVEHVERKVWSGEIPEQKMTMKVMDISGNDPVQGYVRDVNYTLDIPVIMKWEKQVEVDYLEIVGVMPVMKKELDILQVKTKKTTPPASPKKGASEETGEQKNAPPLESPEKVTSEENAGKEDASPQKAATEGDAIQSAASPQESPQKSVTEDM